MKKLTGKTIISPRQLEVEITKENMEHNKEIIELVNKREQVKNQVDYEEITEKLASLGYQEDAYKKNRIPKVETNPSVKSEHLYQELILPTLTCENGIDKLNNTGYLFMNEVSSIEASINNIIRQSPINTNLISDGNKTFGQLYQRIQDLMDERDGKI